MSKKIRIKVLAVFMVLVIGFLVPGGHYAEYQAQAASSKKKYIKEFKIFIAKNDYSYTTKDKVGDTDEAKKRDTAQNWCDSQPENQDDDKDNDWAVINNNLNAGAKGAFTSFGGVYLMYRTTTDPNEAVRDIAVMNEKGNYDEGAYEVMLKEQKDTYIDMVNDMKDMIAEYSQNYKNKVETAVIAHDFMNTYIEDDSKKLLGDYLVDISDEDMVNLLLQANGAIVLMIQQQLAAACDTKKTTWLDRMESIGSYKALRAKAIKAYNNNTSKADKALKNKYHEKAVLLAERWDDIHEHIKSCTEFSKKYGISDMTGDEFVAWEKEHASDWDTLKYQSEFSTLMSLDTYEYEDSTLLAFFNQTKEDVSGANVKKLYPLVASFSEGQLAALNESVSIFSLAESAISATTLNDSKAGKAGEIEQKLDDSQKEVREEVKDNIEDFVEDWIGEKKSVYEGVDRDIFTDGVAVTSNALDFQKSSDTPWADAFVDNGGYARTAIGLAAGSVLAGVMAGFSKYCMNVVFKENVEVIFENLNKIDQEFTGTMRNYAFSKETLNYLKVVPCKQQDAEGAIQQIYNAATYRHDESAQKALSEMSECAMTGTKYKIFNYMKIGFTVFSILLAVADIVMTVTTLVNYYNRDHLPIPHHMVDLTYNEAKETSYIAYKSVPDQKGNYGDLNGDIGKQWLALYQTWDEDAGDPILAPENTKDENTILAQYGSDKSPGMAYSPLHFFGTPNTAQNLTFADGENGWSYNDDNNGVYLFFKRDADTFSGLEEEGEEQKEDEKWPGTAMSSGRTAAVVGFGAAVVLLIGVFIIVGRRRKKR